MSTPTVNLSTEPTDQSQQQPPPARVTSKLRSQLEGGVVATTDTAAFQAPRRVISDLDKLRSISKIKQQQQNSDRGGVAARTPSGLSQPASPTASSGGGSNAPPRSPTGAARGAFANRRVSELKKSSPSQLREPIAAASDDKTSFHLMTTEQLGIALDLGSDALAGGLTTEQVHERRAKYGINALTPPERITLFERFMKNLFSPFSVIMQVAGVLCFIIVGINSSTGFLDVQTLALAIVLFGVAILTSVFQTTQEAQADNLVEALHALTAEKAWVFRDKKLVQVSAEDLVPGDRVKVQLGDKVPADMRVLSSEELKVNNASLTGEDQDILLGSAAGHHDIFEAKNLAWSGCNFTCGNGEGIVFATGDNTRFGQIAHTATESVPPDTLMRREVKRLVIIMSILGAIIGVSFLCASLGTGQPWQSAVIILIGLFVANIPEGLLPQITIALTITARRMVERQVIVSNLEIIETLGAVSVICSDKTGTLTMNRMSVSHLMYDNSVVITPVTPVLPGDDFQMFDRSKSKSSEHLLRVIASCTDAVFTERDDGGSGQGCMAWHVKGDASETGLIRFVQRHEDLDGLREQHRRLCVIPFHSSRKWMATVNADNANPGRQFVNVKGAAERVLARCSSLLLDGEEVPLTSDLQDDCTVAIKEFASRGERVLGFATASLNQPSDFKFSADGENANFPLQDLTLVGFISLSDPPRPSVAPAVDACRVAGIQVIMVTGDHPDTAVAIAKSLGLITLPAMGQTSNKSDPRNHSMVVQGSEIPQMSQTDWDLVLACGECIFARTQPEQKQQLVKQLQRKGLVVAMTGDGVNDSPALKTANVGVAMGSGTSVAKEAAQITIADDDFGSIVAGIREGRTIFENLKKAVTYIITHLSPEIIPYVFSFAFGLPLAIETIVILLIDLGTDMLPGISIAYEEPEPRIMQIPPRSVDSHLIVPRMLVIGYLVFGLLETFFCYYAFVFAFYEMKYDLNMILFLPATYRNEYSDLTDSDADAFRQLCSKNTYYQSHHPLRLANGTRVSPCDVSNSTAGMTDFMHDFSTSVSKAQGAYFITLSVMQFANVIVRRQQTMSTFSPNQFFNWRLFASIVFSTGYAVFFVYVPVVNNAFFLDQTTSASACSALWGGVVIILLDEIRKVMCRVWPDGFVARWTIF
eukprot:PhF_6_TR17072/c1_g1_i1/m.26166/K01539/ATP1A; sodium/potassium-transporting ATPase subunit alpha